MFCPWCVRFFAFVSRLGPFPPSARPKCVDRVRHIYAPGAEIKASPPLLRESNNNITLRLIGAPAKPPSRALNFRAKQPHAKFGPSVARFAQRTITEDSLERILIPPERNSPGRRCDDAAVAPAHGASANGRSGGGPALRSPIHPRIARLCRSGPRFAPPLLRVCGASRGRFLEAGCPPWPRRARRS